MRETPVLAVDLGRERGTIDATLEWVCKTLLTPVPPEVSDAICYSLRSPGRRLRGMLVALSYQAAGGKADPTPLSAAVEIVHAYSLVHDDLPCMDDDDVRRGQPTVHKVYGPSTAMLAGISMIPLAARCVAVSVHRTGISFDTASAIVEALMHAAGAEGMIGGQWLALEAEGERVRFEALETMHRMKTGALITASARIGGLAAGAPGSILTALEQYGASVGLAFQIVDDILDVTSTTNQLGKTAGRDVALGKSTYPGLLGVQEAVDRAQTLVHDGCLALQEAGVLTSELRHLAELMITRTH